MPELLERNKNDFVLLYIIRSKMNYSTHWPKYNKLHSVNVVRVYAIAVPV